METSSADDLTQAQNELYVWIKDYMKIFNIAFHQANDESYGIKISRSNSKSLKAFAREGYISWQEGKARTMQIVDDIFGEVPIMGSVAAGGLIETYADVQEFRYF